MISEGKAGEGSVGCKGRDGADCVSVRGVSLFPLDPRAIVILISTFACSLDDKKWNNDPKEVDEILMS